ncbi:MAG TPA: MEDS domain-containing protein [Planctomycetota bacterium]|nr:MEDS domain-containing protein [Planctomycetota bacterium]
MSASQDHAVHFYEEPGSLLDLLEAFVREGLARKERVVLLTLPGRWKLLADRLRTADRARIVFLDAREALSRILVDGRPDPDRFAALARELLGKTADRPFRVFGDAVDLLAQEGNFEGAVRLEELWNDLRRSRAFSLF